MDTTIPIRYTDPSQEASTLQEIAGEVGKILTQNEEILYVALQNVTALSVRKDAVVATTGRLIFYRPHILGKVDFNDFQWQDVKDVDIKQGILAADFRATTRDGQVVTMASLNKDQTKRLYGICQQMDQEWREKRRVRDMEEARARSGGIVMQTGPLAALAGGQADSVSRLAKAKAMLDQKLISEAEYDTLKAKILAEV